MNFQNTNKILKIVLSVGDESGIGPEIILKALYSNEIPKNIDFLLVGSKKNLQNTYKNLRSLGLENLANPKNLKIYDLEISSSDNEPCSQIEVIQYCYDLLSLKMPKPILFEDAKEELSPIAKSFWMENRRVSNKLLCETLGYKLIYKNYKIGLKNCYLNS